MMKRENSIYNTNTIPANAATIMVEATAKNPALAWVMGATPDVPELAAAVPE